MEDKRTDTEAYFSDPWSDKPIDVATLEWPEEAADESN